MKTEFFRRPGGLILLLILLLLTAAAGIRFGSAELSGHDFLWALIRADGYETESVILWSVRFPRVLAGIAAGIGLSLSGVLLQCVMDNPLAAPNIIGVNAGAGFAVVLTLAFGSVSYLILPFSAFAGAFLAALLIVSVAAGAGESHGSVILAGVAVTALLNAVISGITLMDADILTVYNAFSVGGFRGVKTEQLVLPSCIIAACLAVSLILSRKLDLLCLGDSGASLLGVNVKRVRLAAILCASASAAAVVSYAGLLGFVGLIVPHMARKLTGHHTGYTIAVSAMLGGILTVSADLAGRILAAPSEIPVGIMMSFLGAPFFLWLLRRRKGW